MATQGNSYYFVIVAKNDNPIYEVEFLDAPKKENTHLSQFILHSSLDMVDETVWRNNQMKYLEPILPSTTLIDLPDIRFMILHDQKNEDGIKNFFNDVYELYVKILLNPFYVPNSAITSPLFDTKVKALGKKHFNTRYP